MPEEKLPYITVSYMEDLVHPLHGVNLMVILRHLDQRYPSEEQSAVDSCEQNPEEP